MVKLTTKYLHRKLSKKNPLQPRKKDESDVDYLNRITHLYLQSQFIDKISAIPQCQSVSVIYLQHNLLQSIQNMASFPKLTHLYLQHNFISKIENLESLSCLKKLYLGYNEISVVEGLEGLKNLVELHLENQRLPQGETLYFDPRTVSHMRHSLQVLNIANNNISSIACLEGLMSLSKLVVDGNQIQDLNDFMETISYMPSLVELSSSGNPVCSDRKYLDAAIVASKSLVMLDGKRIEDKTRIFVTKMSDNRERRRRLSEFSTKAVDSEDSLPDSRGDSVSKARAYPRIGSKLFPVFNELEKRNPIILKLPSKNISANSLSPVFQNSLKVSHLWDSFSN